MAASIPLKRLGTSEDEASAVLFFASREAGYIRGQSLIIDSGQVLPESLQAHRYSSEMRAMSLELIM
ncbi:3-ketoacyl-(acyl-carrier-protein) reductase [compost metagenome]